MVDKSNNVIDLAYKAFVPSPDEYKKLEEVADDIKEQIRREATLNKVNVEVVPAGSFARRTWVSGKSDIDIFVVFDSEEAIINLPEIVPKGFSPVMGSRRYFKAQVKGVIVEIVPIVNFSKIKDVRNSIDFSVLHTNYLKPRLSENMRKDIIILKQFCIANNCYGSETYLHGMSGYALELLILRFGDIGSLFEAVKTWKEGVFVDLAQTYSSLEDAKLHVGAPDTPIIIIDPTNPFRNICGSLNLQNFYRFVFAVKRFLLFPSIEMFKEQDVEKGILNRAKYRKTKVFKYKTKIVGDRTKFLSKYNKNLQAFIKSLSENDIDIYSYEPVFYDDYVSLILEVKAFPSSRTRAIRGPSVLSNVDIINNFMKQHKSVYLSEEHLSYDKPYSTTNFKKFITSKAKEFISDGAITKR